MPSSSATRSRRPISNPTGDYGQNLFDRYVAYADAWIEDQDYKDPDTGQLMDRELLNQELSKIEKPAGIANPKDFRNEVVKFALRARAANPGENPSWTSYEKMREVIEKRMFSQVEDLLPVISFGSKKDSDTEKKHADFLERMVVARLHRAPGAPPGRVVHARQQGRLGADDDARSGGKHDEHYRPPAQSQGQEPQQPAALPRRARAPRSNRRVQNALRKRKVADVEHGEKVAIPTRGIAEPAFHHSRRTGGKRTRRARQQGICRRRRDPAAAAAARGGGGSQGQPATGGQDAFEFTLSKDEFLDMFFEDLELPDLVKKSLQGDHRGRPAARRLHRHRQPGQPQHPPHDAQQHGAAHLAAPAEAVGDRGAARAQVEAARPRRRRGGASALTLDLERRRARAARSFPTSTRSMSATIASSACRKPNTQAVMFCLMDVSGSMTEAMKDLAKRFFLLLHVFLMRRYQHVDVVFIRHTCTAEEVDEETFFHSRETGGTMVSTALEKMLEIARARYPTDRWNIYAAQASDGDNYGADSGRCVELLGGEVLPLCQYFAYIEVGDGDGRQLTGLAARQRSVARL